MNWPVACVAVIPCRDEAPTIGPLVAAVRRQVETVFVVDDGSRDATARLAQQAGATVLNHHRTRGKGAALRTGWETARARGFSWALCLDGDGQHAPGDIPAFFASADVSGAQLIVGNRLHDPTAMPWVRRQVNRWMSRRLSAVAGRFLPDSQCGFRLLSLNALARLSIETQHYEIESEMLLAFARARIKLAFVPIRVIYREERSKINPLIDTLRWMRWYGSNGRYRETAVHVGGDPVSDIAQ